MGRGVNSGGGQSSPGYLFGSSEAPAPKPVAKNVEAPVASHVSEKPSAVARPADSRKQIPAGIQVSRTNNYFRADGQNTGNFLTYRPSTKVHAAPGGGSSWIVFSVVAASNKIVCYCMSRSPLEIGHSSSSSLVASDIVNL